MLIGTKHSGYSRANIRLLFDPVTIMAAGGAEVAAITAAEIAAAEAAAVVAAEAAAVASAEAAAVQAAQAAAATAAETGAITAAEAGAIQANNIAAGQAVAADAAAQAGIMQVGGTTAAPLTAEAVNAAATGQMTPGQLEYLRASTASNIPGAVPGQGMLPAQPLPNVDLAQYGIKGAEFTKPSVSMPEFDPSAAAMPSGPVPYESSFLPAENSLSTQLGNTPGASPYDIGRPPATSSTEGLRMGSSGFQPTNAPTPTGGGGFQSNMSSVSNMFPDKAKDPDMLDKILNYADKNPFKTGAAMYMGASKLGLLDPEKQTFNDKPYDGPLSKYRMSPDFQGRTATPNIYQPTYPTYAAGGIMNAGPVQSMSDQNNAMGYQQAMAATGGQVANFAKGGKTGNLSDSLDYYTSMIGGTKAKAPNEPGWSGSAGIARDDDPDTRSRDALTAAQIRNAKVNKRANLSIPNMKRPTPMGQINLAAPGIKSSDKEDVQEAAAGGIMGASSLGGYAAGGNPRLLRGPGDGMSDNIPAMIGKKQPARLADGEFVVPADVVSHLGNGSTEAGAKRLHEMMNKVRRDRTGNSKQGKQIVAAKYMPK
jgi:hypothetical protein